MVHLTTLSQLHALKCNWKQELCFFLMDSGVETQENVTTAIKNVKMCTYCSSSDTALNCVTCVKLVVSLGLHLSVTALRGADCLVL